MKKIPIIKIEPMKIPMMKSYDVVGYIEKGGMYCKNCAKDKSTPIFAGDEFECRQYCENCYGEIPVNVWGEE